MKAYIALRDRSPSDNTVAQITSTFQGVTVDPQYTGPHTLLRVDDAELTTEFVNSIVTDFKGSLWPATDNGRWVRDYLDELGHDHSTIS